MSIQMQQKYVKKFYIIHIEFSNSGGEFKKKFVLRLPWRFGWFHRSDCIRNKGVRNRGSKRKRVNIVWAKPGSLHVKHSWHFFKKQKSRIEFLRVSRHVTVILTIFRKNCLGRNCNFPYIANDMPRYTKKLRVHTYRNVRKIRTPESGSNRTIRPTSS